MGDNIAGRRRSYTRAELRRAELADSWVAQLQRWLDDAIAHPDIIDESSMVLATAAPDATPSARTVLLKGLDAAGLVFYTNLGSRKATELIANPRASAVLAWAALERQVIVCGPVRQVDRAEVAGYAQSRPRGSQLGAWASHQSQPVAGREELDAALAAAEARWPESEPIAVPPFWGGFRLAPVTVEFWQGRPNRMHDRLRYVRDDAGDWSVVRLFP